MVLFHYELKNPENFKKRLHAKNDFFSPFETTKAFTINCFNGTDSNGYTHETQTFDHVMI
jgi:hypothetical protein